MSEARVLIIDADTAGAQKMGLALDGAKIPVTWCSFAPTDVAEGVRDFRPTLLLVEGELNAVSLWQVAHERADVLSCGSQEGILQAETRRLLATLIPAYTRVFIWLDALPRAASATPLIAPATGYALWSEGGLDANDRLRDGTLAAWLAAHGGV